MFEGGPSTTLGAGPPEGLTTNATGTVSPRVRLAWQEVVPGAGMGLPDYYDGGRPMWGAPYRYPGVARFSPRHSVAQRRFRAS